MNRLCVVCAYLAHKPGAKSFQAPVTRTKERDDEVCPYHLFLLLEFTDEEPLRAKRGMGVAHIVGRRKRIPLAQRLGSKSCHPHQEKTDGCLSICLFFMLYLPT